MLEQTVGGRHYFWLFFWWGCLCYEIAKNSITASLLFLTVFFLASTYKALFKSFLIGIVCVLIAAIPFVNVLFMVLGVICIFLRIKFLIKHWRILLTGIYAYGVHCITLIGNSFSNLLGAIGGAARLANHSGIEAAQSVASTASTGVWITGIVIATILTLVLHKMILWLYKHNYSTERSFLIMGLSPLIIMAIVLPFLSHLKIGNYDVTGDSFLDADSFSDASDSLLGVETGVMGMAAHGINVLATEKGEEREEEQEPTQSDVMKIENARQKYLGGKELAVAENQK